ncbi:MAG: type II toxin-antitoxin system VapC family toxin [Sulfolobales archaeon]
MPRRIVIDASLLIDLYAAPDENRASIAEEIVKWIMQGSAEAYAPKLLIVEIVGVLTRYLLEEELDLALDTLPSIKLIPEETIYEEAIRIARKTGSRAADAYYIAVASIVNGVLLTNDRIQAQNAKKAAIEAYYLVEEIEMVKRLFLT